MPTPIASSSSSSQTAMERPASDRSWVPVAVLCVTILFLLARLFKVDLIDDSYIFLRYARNIAHGYGAVFNVSQRVEGFSSPLWTLLLGALGTLTGHFEILAYVLGMMCGAGTIVGLLRGLHKNGTSPGWPGTLVLGLGLATGPALVFWSGSGMDTGLFLLVLTVVFGSVLRDLNGTGLSARSTVLLVLATLTRMEGLLLTGYIALVFLIEHKSIRRLTGYVAAIAAALLVRYAYYGQWVPNTYYAKVTFSLGRRLSDGFDYLLPALRANALLLGATAAIVILAWRRRLLKPTFLFLLGGWPVLWSAYVLYVGGDNFALFRFLLPTLPALFLLLGFSWSALHGGLDRRARTGLLVGLACAWAVSNIQTYRAQAKGYYGDVRLARAWEAVGKWIDRRTPPQTVIATIVPGALGYFGRRPTIDMLGLTDRSVSIQGKVFPAGGHGHARYNTDYLFQRAPDLIIYHSSGRFRRPVYADPQNIPVVSGFALYDFVTDPRCKQRYTYRTTRLANGTVVEMLQKKARKMTETRAASARAG